MSFNNATLLAYYNMYNITELELYEMGNKKDNIWDICVLCLLYL